MAKVFLCPYISVYLDYCIKYHTRICSANNSCVFPFSNSEQLGLSKNLSLPFAKRRRLTFQKTCTNRRKEDNFQFNHLRLFLCTSGNLICCLTTIYNSCLFSKVDDVENMHMFTVHSYLPGLKNIYLQEYDKIV